ncbi:MAG: hypothetical protein CMA64_06955 [Euryarchaeota archaeon]|nr:hypothetical protein [Euryarchaeota archaeon]
MTRITTLNLPTFYKSMIGFDHMFETMDRLFENSSNGHTGYPPYNIAKINEDAFMISVAVAGFGMDNLKIEKDQNILKIEGKSPEGVDDVDYLHRGVAGRNFVREFTLAEHVDVKEAKLENGMLNVHLVREVPEELKPQTINIVNGDNDK